MKRPRLGLILHGIGYSYQESILRGADEECRAQDADLICFAGGDFGNEQLADRTYDIIDGAVFDGILIAMSTMGAAVGSRQLEALFQKLKGIPICSLGYAMPGAISVLVDATSTVEVLTRHLIDRHGRRSIAFIEGNNSESDERRAAYRRALESRGLAEDPELIFAGNYYRGAGGAAVERLLDRGSGGGHSGRRCRADAIVAANDWMALGAMRALASHGLRVPDDVAVVGFDDIDQARFETPSMTTIRQPTEELGAYGVRAILSRVRGEQVESTIHLTTELQIRQSCGCFSGIQPRPAVRTVSMLPGPPSREATLRGMARVLDEAAPNSKLRLTPEWSSSLARALDADLASCETHEFEKALEGLIVQTASLGNVPAWHHVLTVLRNQVVEVVATLSELKRADELFDGARQLIGAHAERVQGERRLATEDLLRALTHLSEDLRAASSYDEIAGVLARQLPHLDVPGCLVSAHEGSLSPETPLQVVAAYDRQRGRLEVDGNFRAGDLFPAPAAPERRATWIATVATFKRDVVGYCMLEVSRVEASRYVSICEQVGVALNAVRLLHVIVDEVTRRERAERERLESEIALATHIQTGLLPRVQEVRGMKIASAMLPATEVGGDYFDVIPIEKGAWFAIGDVSGHGLSAGLVMLMIQSIFSAITAVQPDAAPRLVWTELNRVLYENVRRRLQQDEHATLTVLRYFGKGNFAFAGAHEDMIVYRTAGGRCELVPTPGTWAGIAVNLGPEGVKDTALHLEPGDTLLLYTDGVIEARNKEGELFGLERLSDALASLNDSPVEIIVERVIQLVRSWMDRQLDDISLLVIRYTGQE